MQINVTFIIQIVNFWISYAMLHKLLFKPFVGIINNKQAARQILIKGLKHKELALITLQDDKKKNLEDFRTHIKQQYDFTPLPLIELSQPFAFSCNQDEIDRLIETQKNLIIQKAPHAY